MKYKVGDKVKIKSFDWFKANEYSGQEIQDVHAFLEMTDECCGKELTIDFIFTDERGSGYIMKEPKIQWRFTDDMIEDLVEEPREKMVSLEKVEEWLYKNFYESYPLNNYGEYDLDEPYIASLFNTINEMFDDFHKTMEE